MHLPKLASFLLTHVRKIYSADCLTALNLISRCSYALNDDSRSSSQLPCYLPVQYHDSMIYLLNTKMMLGFLTRAHHAALASVELRDCHVLHDQSDELLMKGCES